MVIRKRSWTSGSGKTNTAWEIDYKDPLGRRIKQSGFKTKTEAEAACAKAKVETNNGVLPCKDKNITFEEAAEIYMSLHADLHCKQSTIDSYNSNITNHLNPYFGKLKLIEINPNLINRYMQLKLKEGLSPKTINNGVTLMGSIIQKMIDDGLIGQNPVTKVKRLKLPHREMKFFEQTEIVKVFEVAKKECPDFYPLLRTAIMTGMCRGELIALTWDDVNFEERKISVSKSLFKGKIASPKTRNSIRKIDMQAKLVDVLKKWKLKCPKGQKNLVFPSSKGGFLDPTYLVKWKFGQIIKKAGVKTIRFHDLRHTYAALLVAKNAPIKYIQSQMGHSSIQVTLDRYGHLMEETNQKGLEALDSLM